MGGKRRHGYSPFRWEVVNSPTFSGHLLVVIEEERRHNDAFTRTNCARLSSVYLLYSFKPFGPRTVHLLALLSRACRVVLIVVDLRGHVE